MNALAKELTKKITETDRFCEKHKERMINVGGRDFCKTCALKSVEQAQIDHHQAVNRMVREKHFAGAMLPDRHLESGFKNYIVQNQGQKIAKSQCQSFAKDFNGGVKRNLIMVGRTGTGKTHLACAVARNVLDQRSYVRYVTSEDMANEIANAWTKADDSEASAVWRFTDYDLLIIDEYGLHDQHESRLQLPVRDFDTLLDQLHKVGRGPNVVGRWLHRNQHEVGRLDGRHGQVGRLGRSVDHDEIHFAGHVLHVPVNGWSVDADHG